MNNWQIKDLKGVGDVELNLDSNQRVFTFLGTNGVGKTRTLEALLSWFITHNIQMNASHYLIDFDEKYFWEKSFGNIHYSTKNESYQLTESDRIDKREFALCFVGTNNRGSVAQTKNNAKNTISVFDIMMNAIRNNRVSDILTNNIHQWIIDRARFINPYQIEKDNSQIAIESVLKCLHKIDNAFDDKFLQINENNNVYLKVNGEVLELSELSSGFLSLVKIIQSIIASFSAFTNKKDLLNVKGVVLIDEIESHLHLEWQVKIIPILKNLFPNTTFYITTHSPLVLSQLNEGEAYLLKRDDDNVVRSHLINSPNTRLLENVLQDAFGVNLNELKRQNMANIDQSKAKKKLLDLLNSQVS